MSEKNSPQTQNNVLFESSIYSFYSLHASRSYSIVARMNKKQLNRSRDSSVFKEDGNVGREERKNKGTAKSLFSIMQMNEKALFII